MFVHGFQQPLTLNKVETLRALFSTDLLFMAAGAQLTLSGEITLGPNVNFSGVCELIGPSCVEDGSILTNVRLGAGARVRAYSVLSDLVAGADNLFGPFCFIRDGCIVDDNAILGAHVEATRSRFATGVKISHRAFVGDARIGARTIIGAGVVFCNFDGRGRQSTKVGEDVIIGSGSMIVPPISIGAGANIAAGSTVTKNVADGAKVLQKR